MNSDVLLGGLLTVAGAVLGGALGSIVLGRLERNREERRNGRDHATAVRAVAFELTSSAIGLSFLNSPGDAVVVSTDCCKQVLLPLYSRLPADLGSQVAFAYALLYTGRGGSSTQETVSKTAASLVAYGRGLGLEFANLPNA